MQQVLEKSAASNMLPQQDPFPIESMTDEHRKYILEKLEEAELYAANPDAKWYTWEEVRDHIKQKYGI